MVTGNTLASPISPRTWDMERTWEGGERLEFFPRSIRFDTVTILVSIHWCEAYKRQQILVEP